MATDHTYQPDSNRTPVEDRRYWQIPVFLLGLVAAYYAYQYTPKRTDVSAASTGDFADLRSALSQKSVDAATIEPLLQRLSKSATTTPEHFQVGNGYLSLAELAPSENTTYWAAASQSYEQCDPAKLEQNSDTGKLAYRAQLAKAAINTGDPSELLKSLQTPPPGEDRVEAARVLAQTALRTNPPNRPLAKEYLAKYLGSQTRAAGSLLSRCKLELARLHINDKENDKARKWLNDLSVAAPADVQALAKAHLGQVAAMENNWAEAAAQYENALLAPTLPNAERAAIRYQAGVAWLNAGSDREAEKHFLQSAKEPGAIGGAAALKLATVRGRDPASKGVRSEAADWLERAVAQVGTSTDLTAPELRASFEEVIKTSKSEGDYPAAFRAATAYTKVAEANVDRKHRAEICEQWANALLKSNPADAKAKFVESANEYVALAESMIDPKSRAELLRKSVVQYRQAGENSKANDVVSAIFNVKGLPEEFVAQAWLDRADLLPATQAAEIEDALKKAVEMQGPASNQARVKLGLNYIKRSQELLATTASSTKPEEVKAQAQAMNQLGRSLVAQVADAANVSMSETPTHEQALFELGRLAMLDQKYLDAEGRFRKQLSLYANGLHADNARLWIASVLLAKADSDATIAPKARQEALVYLKELSKSPDRFFQTWGELWEANTLLRSGDTAGTIALSKDLIVKHSGKLEELVASKLLVHAYIASKPRATEEASRVLTRMEELFQSLPRESFRTDPEYSYEHWKAELPKLREIAK